MTHATIKKVQSCEFYNTEVYCILFWLMFLPLQVAPGFACSVASLNQSPGHQLPGCHSLRCGTLADYLLGQDKPSTQFAGHVLLPHNPPPSSAKRQGFWHPQRFVVLTTPNAEMEPRVGEHCSHEHTPPCRSIATKKLFTLLDLCVSSLRRGHANLLCIVPILTDDPRRESEEVMSAKTTQSIATQWRSRMKADPRLNPIRALKGLAARA